MRRTTGVSRHRDIFSTTVASFLACEDFGRLFDNSFPACALFFFFKVKIRAYTLIPFFRPGSVYNGSPN